MSELQKKWNNIPDTVLKAVLILICVFLVLIVGMDLKEVNSLVPALENLSVNWLTAYDVTGVSADHMLYPIQYVGMLIWGMVPLWIFRMCLDTATNLPEVLLAVWYKVLEIYLLYQTLVYVEKITEFYQHKELSNTWKLVCAVPAILYCAVCKESWNIIVVLLLVMGLYYYLQDRMSLFVICFLFGALCHPAVLLFYVPLVFWKNRRVKRICDYLICLLLPLGMEFMMFISSAGFRTLLGEVIRQQDWRDALAWGVCLIISVFAFLRRGKKEIKELLYEYIIISMTLWFANGMKEGYLVLLAVMIILVCVQSRNVSGMYGDKDIQIKDKT